HWSASFTLIPDLKCWIVELACRSPVSPDHLCSTYRIDGSVKKSDTGAIELDTTPTVTCEAIAPAMVEVEQQKLSIRPAKLPTEAATTQWAFRLRCDC
ncbi:MAG TPA: hypothetical protein DDW52_14130, partial [Planctomycetaceae bacterium]|nr:hypothetical protein [Planctomycetaceae bacterium]